MIRQTITFIAPFAIALLISGDVQAGADQDGVKLCRAEMLTQMPALENAADIKFRSVRGGRLRHFTFEYKTTDGKQKAVCKVKRGEIVGIDWS